MKLRWLPAAVLCLGWASQAQDDGKALLERACTKCHGLTATLRQRNSRERWSTIVDDMIARGAEASDAELEKIIDYLAKNFGPRILVNKASAEELAAGLGIPQFGRRRHRRIPAEERRLQDVGRFEEGPFARCRRHGTQAGPARFQRGEVARTILRLSY
jgi:hypothetical protein